MTHEEKIQWMAVWAARNGVQLVLEGECGFGRECVGIAVDGTYPDYEWFSPDYMERIDPNGEVWTPAGAYHKHPCVAVLGRGEVAEARLYEWLRWFDENGFKVTTGDASPDPQLGMLAYVLGKHRFARMVRSGPVEVAAQA